jgi:hypothetical protein
MVLVLRLLVVGLAIVSLSCPVSAQARDRPKVVPPPKGYRWEVEARKHRLGEEDVRLLRKNNSSPPVGVR